MRGRKPVPTVLANLHGNPTKTKPKAAEPKPAGNLYDPPEFLSDDQKANWRYALDNAPPGLLKRLDRAALVAFIVAEDLHRQATGMQNKVGLLTRTPGKRVVRRNGETIESPGFLIQSPFLPIINRQALIMLKAASELGFTPVSRPRIFAGPPAPGEGLHGGNNQTHDTLEDFLSRDPDRPTIN